MKRFHILSSAVFLFAMGGGSDASAAEVVAGVAGVDYESFDYDGLDIHMVTIDRGISGYELQVLGARAGENQLYTRTVQEMAEDAGAVVAINGYFFSGNNGTERNQLTTPSSTLFMDFEEVRDCYSDNKVECFLDLSVLGLAGNTNVTLLTTDEFQDAENSEYRKSAMGSDFPFLRNGVCSDGKPTDRNARTAIGYSADAVYLMTTESVSGLTDSGLDRQDLCNVMIEAGASDAVMLDGGPAVGMVVDGEHVNSLIWPASQKYGKQRHVANGIGLVKTEGCNDPVVSLVAPEVAQIGKMTIFGIVGSCLPSATAFFIEGCANLETLYITPNYAEFSCMPTGSPGVKQGVIKNKPGGAVLSKFQVEFVKTGDICPDGNGLYCGESVELTPGTLYQCTDGAFGASEVCADGCVDAGQGNNDFCAGGGNECPDGDGLYCGEAIGKTPGTLYSCSSGVFSQSKVCSDGCVDAGQGQNDYCKNAPCDCNSGSCCDGCSFRPSNYVCESKADSKYDCLGNGCGADVSVQTRDQYCSGSSTSCNGQLGSWSAESVYDSCSSGETCSAGDSSCNPDAMCCTDTYTIESYKCNTYSSANGSGEGGGEIMEVCGLVDSNGHVTVKVRKHDGTDFGSRPYQVRVSSIQDDSCGPDTYGFDISDSNPSGVGSDQLIFDFDSIWENNQTDKAYCVTASTTPNDGGYDPNSNQQKSWWYSDKFELNKSCQ